MGYIDNCYCSNLLLPKNIAVLTLWRDGEGYISNSLSQFEAFEEDLGNSYTLTYSFYENDSKDNTAQILVDWLRNRRKFFTNTNKQNKKWGSIMSKNRTKKLASYRNICLSPIKRSSYDYIFISDSDLIYGNNFLRRMINILENNSNIGMITPNTIQSIPDEYGANISHSYFDSWALIDREGNSGLTFASNPFLLPSDRSLWRNNHMVYVNSAFGGAALVRGELIKQRDVNWSGNKGCEHWFFCEKIRELNYDIAVDPKLIARVNVRPKPFKDLFLINYERSRLRLSYLNKRKTFNYLLNKIYFWIFSILLYIKRKLAKILLIILN